MRFKIECPNCGEKAEVEPSIFQVKFGMLDFGRANCPSCNFAMKLTLVLDEENHPKPMIAS